MGVMTTLAIASLVVAAGSAYASYSQGQAAAGEQKKANATSQAQQAVTEQQNIRDQVRAQRIKTAQISQASQDTGVSASSGDLGAQSAIGSQVGGNVGNMQGSFASNMAVSADLQSAASDRSRANTYSQVGALAGSSFNLFSNTPQFQAWSAKTF